jgi:hypothetical protein
MVFSITDEFGNSINCNGGNVILQILLYKTPEPAYDTKFNKMVQDYIEMKTNLLEYDLRDKQELKNMIQTINQTLLQLMNKLNVPQNKEDGTITEEKTTPQESPQTQPEALQYFAGEAPTGENNESTTPPQQTG